MIGLDWLQRIGRTARLLVVVAASGAIVLSLALLAFFVFWERDAERYTSGLTPTQFARQLEGDLLDDYAGVYGVAHNSGDSLDATREALRKGADVIEIDVVRSGGSLYAGHDSPLPWIGKRFFRGPRLEEVWELAAQGEAIKLDLKESSSGYLDALIVFLEEHEGPDVIVSSRSVKSLEVLKERYPSAIRLLSVPSERRFRQLQEREHELAIIDGVTMRHTLIDEEVGSWLEERGLITLAWTVNDAPRLNELVKLGVDAITTDNLNILQLLGGQQRGEGRLTRPAR